MVTIQLLIKINAHRIYKKAQNNILRLSNFRLQNLSNLDAVIQIFLCLHKPNFTVFHLCVTFHHTVARKYLHCNAMIFVYRVFSRLHLITDLEVFCLGTKIPQNGFYATHSFFFNRLNFKICGNLFHKFSFFKKVQDYVRALLIDAAALSSLFGAPR